MFMQIFKTYKTTQIKPQNSRIALDYTIHFLFNEI